MTSVDDLTAVAQDYVKVIWSATEWGEPPITTKGLATRFDTTQANVSDTMRRLAAQGLVNYEPYKPVTLTELGTRLAVAMVRRHRLIETFLAGVLGYGWDEVHEDAERLEHAASDDFLDRIDDLLGHPGFDPHGDPIPTLDGGWRPPADTARLIDAAPGTHVVVRVSDADTGTLGRLLRLGVVPGTRLVVHDGRVSVEGGTAVLDAADLPAVRVRPAG